MVRKYFKVPDSANAFVKVFEKEAAWHRAAAEWFEAKVIFYRTLDRLGFQWEWIHFWSVGISAHKAVGKKEFARMRAEILRNVEPRNMTAVGKIADRLRKAASSEQNLNPYPRRSWLEYDKA